MTYSPHSTPGEGWYICDGSRIYINRPWNSEQEAKRELAQLLRYYSANDPWRQRLTVAHKKQGNINDLRGKRKKVCSE